MGFRNAVILSLIWIALGSTGSAEAKNSNLALNWNCSSSYADFKKALADQDWAVVIEKGRKVVGQCEADLSVYNVVELFGPMAEGYIALGRPADALATADQCLAYARHALPCYFAKADALAANGRQAEARGYFQRIVDLSLTSTNPAANDYADRARRKLAALTGDTGGSAPAGGEEASSGKHHRKTAKTGSWSGTGFYVAANTLVTNNHVVDGCANMQAANDHSTLTVIDRDPTNDLALVRSTTAAPAMLRVRSSPAKLGEQILAFGFPLRGLLSDEGNISTGVVTALKGLRDDAKEIQISAPVQPGNSGGAVLDAAGRVVAVVHAGLNEIQVARVTGVVPQNVNFAIALDRLTAILDSHKVAYEKAVATTPLKTEEVADLAKRASVQILCRR